MTAHHELGALVFDVDTALALDAEQRLSTCGSATLFRSVCFIGASYLAWAGGSSAGDKRQVSKLGGRGEVEVKVEVRNADSAVTYRTKNPVASRDGARHYPS